jgi:hypothetical protein
MAAQKCPACGSTKGKNEPGSYALLKVSGRDTIQINLNTSTMEVMTVKARVCGNCAFVSFTDVP